MNGPGKKIRALVVDDSALVRQMLGSILEEDGDIDVVGTATDPYDAREKIKRLNPDVLTLDVEMPKMDGITFLSNLMRLRPMPVVMVSSLTEKGAEVTLNALELGAIDFVAKPKVGVVEGLNAYAEDIRARVRQAAAVPRHRLERRLATTAATVQPAPPRLDTTDKLIAIGASTGGTEAIKDVLMALPSGAPGVVITQHIPEAFSASFAKRMDRVCSLSVSEAVDGQQILPGHAYIAPGNRHLLVERSGTRFVCRLNDGPPVNRHKPSVDVLFRSVAEHVGHNAVAAILTGMGDDGAQGLLAMRQAGAATLAQDEATSVVWGMPGEAVKAGAAQHVLPLGEIAGRLLTLVARKQPA